MKGIVRDERASRSDILPEATRCSDKTDDYGNAIGFFVSIEIYITLVRFLGTDDCP